MSRAGWHLAGFLCSVAGLAAGVGWWIAPGAGLALGSMLLGGLALLHDDGRPTPGRPVRRQDTL